MPACHRPHSMPLQKELKTAPIHRNIPIHATNVRLTCAGIPAQITSPVDRSVYGLHKYIVGHQERYGGREECLHRVRRYAALSGVAAPGAHTREHFCVPGTTKP
ncbi:hypothetical protein ACJJTC_008215, partial [Scirpophaga incertulas]